MGEESSTSTTTLPKIPTVNKVSAMIDDKLKTNSENVKFNWYYYITELPKNLIFIITTNN